MKRKIFLSIIVYFSLLLVSCGNNKNDNRQYEEETSILLTDEMKQEIERKLTQDENGIVNEEINLIQYIGLQNSVLKHTKDINLEIDSVNITSWEQQDDYSYIVYGKAYNTDNYNNTQIYTFKAIYKFVKDTEKESGYKIDIHIDEYKKQ